MEKKMKFISFLHEGTSRFGVLKDDNVFDLTKHTDFPDLKSLIASGNAQAIATEVMKTQKSDHLFDDLKLLSIIPNSEKIFCVALNYHDHVAEANAALPGGRDTPEYPMIFVRFPESLVGHEQDIVVPSNSHQLDYEAELLVVIGQDTPRHVKVEDALEYVFGYSAINEGSIRDYQFHSRQLTPGKNFQDSGSTGPWLITADEIGDPQALEVEFILNDKILQKANTSDMIFSVAQLIAYITEWIPLKPGDMIASGTMGGVGFTRKPPIFMKPGDKAEVKITNLGTLSNGIRNEKRI